MSPRNSINNNSHSTMLGLVWKSGSLAIREDSSKNILPWEERKISLDKVAEKIPNGSSVYISSCAATAASTLEAMTDDWKMANIQVIQLIPGGNLPHLKECADRFRTSSYFSYRQTGYFKNGDAEGLQVRNVVVCGC
jgi:hypothetical protein